jgi:GntR family transcriptional repressor for pyruvate dehydrogenase complex
VSENLSPIARTSVFDEVFDRLVGFIINEGLRPGDKLPPERELGTQLQVGRSSIREAIRAMSAIGVVEVTPRGMVVGRGDASLLTKPLSWGLLMTPTTAREVVEARAVVETALAAMAAEHASARDLEELQARLSEMASALDDPDRYATGDVAFHHSVARAGRNVVLSHVVQMLRHVSRAWIDIVISGYEVRPASLEEHTKIYVAICSHDPEAARAAMAAHLEAAGERLLTVISHRGNDYVDAKPSLDTVLPSVLRGG